MIGHKQSFVHDLRLQWNAQNQLRSMLRRIGDQLEHVGTEEERRSLLRQKQLLNEQLKEEDLMDFVQARLEDHLKVLIHSGMFLLNDDMDE